MFSPQEGQNKHHVYTWMLTICLHMVSAAGSVFVCVCVRNLQVMVSASMVGLEDAPEKVLHLHYPYSFFDLDF
eukprot:1139278-Pelagomonas_calceolata.AAC.2